MLKNQFKYPIVFCANGEFKNHSLVAIISILENNPEFTFKFYLLCSSHDPSWSKQTGDFLASYGSSFIEIPVNEQDYSSFPVMHHFSFACYYRIMIPELIPESEYIYMDSDIICNGSLAPFLEVDMTGYAVAAVEDPVYKWKESLGMSSSSRYFNSGVMLVDATIWNQKNIRTEAVEFLVQFPDKIRFVDQCALNAILDGSWRRLPPRFNQQGILYRQDFEPGDSDWSNREMEEAVQHPILVHYTGPSKPWQYNCPHPLKHLYWQYQRRSPFRLKSPVGMTWSDHIKQLVPKSLKQKIKDLFN